jgi:hypothetical protein
VIQGSPEPELVGEAVLRENELDETTDGELPVDTTPMETPDLTR